MGFDPHEPEQRRRLRAALKASDVRIDDLTTATTPDRDRDDQESADQGRSQSANGQRTGDEEPG